MVSLGGKELRETVCYFTAMYNAHFSVSYREAMVRVFCSSLTAGLGSSVTNGLIRFSKGVWSVAKVFALYIKPQ